MKLPESDEQQALDLDREKAIDATLMDKIRAQAEANPIELTGLYVPEDKQMPLIEQTDFEEKNFIPQALVTESKDFEVIRQRLSQQLTIEAVFALYQSSVQITPWEDNLKKHVFYGDDLKDFIQVHNFSDDVVARLQDIAVIRLFHSILGLLTEVRELEQALFDHVFNGKPLDLINIQEEFGDTMWYQALGLDAIGQDSFSRTMRLVIRKLRTRYKDKFTEFDAMNRNLKTERSVLENKPEYAFLWVDQDGQEYMVHYRWEEVLDCADNGQVIKRVPTDIVGVFSEAEADGPDKESLDLNSTWFKSRVHVLSIACEQDLAQRFGGTKA